MADTRKIIHVDMDAFYASVEQRDDPQLRGRPIIIGGSPQSRGVVCTASYEARVFGVRSAMSCAKAARLCPSGIFVPPDFTKYRQASQKMHEIFRDYADEIEPLSLDEAYLDVTHNKAGLASATATAVQIRERVREELHLTISAGVSCNKLIAKLASDENKPDGLCVVPPHRIADFLAGRPLRHLPGIGPKTAERLERFKLSTIDDFLAAPASVRTEALGNQAERYYRFANGIDHRPVRRRAAAKQVSVERTFSDDLADPEQLRAKIDRLCEDCWNRTTKKPRLGRTVTLKCKFADFTLRSRSHTDIDGITSLDQLQSISHQLLTPLMATGAYVRLLGIGLSNWLSTDEPDAPQVTNDSPRRAREGEIELIYDQSP
jgi:DNA polymerase-4